MILLNFETQIKGDSTVEEHTDWITLDSVQFGVGRAISMSGGGRDREVSNPSFSEVTFSKSTDVSSADIYYQAIQGKSLGKAEIHFIQTGGTNTSQVYLTVELTDAIGRGGDELGPEHDAEKLELKAILTEAIDELPEKERLVLSLYYFENVTMREVGEVLGVTESRVSQLHAKAVKRLQCRLRDPLGMAS